MKTTLQSIAATLIFSLVTTALFSQNKNKGIDYLDPTENFYATQSRMNNHFKKFEKELAEERREKDKKIAQGASSKTAALKNNEEHEVASFEIYKRWENYMAPRVYPSGDKTLPSKAYEEYAKYLSESSQQNSSSKTGPNSIMYSTWQPIGPFGDLSGANAGRINSVNFDPASSTGYWASAPDGGLWKTTNSGSTWSTNTDYLTAIGFSDVVFDPTNSQNIYAATGDGDAGDCMSIGVLKSTNGGVTWAPTGLTWTVNQGRRIYKLLINPLNKNTIFAATTNGLYRTQNGGTNWTQIIVANVSDVEYKPNDTTTVYAVSTSFYKSTNGGTSFATITSGLPTSAANNRMAIAVSPANNAIVNVVASNATNDGFLGFYKSNNSATTFTSMATTPNLLGWASAGNDVGGQGWYDLAIAASPTNANEVIVGGVNIWRTTNGGTNWSLFAHWTGSGAPYVHADIHDLKYKSGTEIYVSCDGGVFYSTNSGSTFFSMNGNMNIAQIYKIGLSSTTYSRAITGHQDNGTNLFTSGSWVATMGGDGMDCFIDRTNDNVMYGEQYNGAFKRTTNGGAAWSTIVTGLTGTGAWVTPWHQDPVVANTIYGGRQQMFKSTNQGTNWAQIGTLGGSGSIVEFAVAPSNPLVIYVIKGNALYKTINGGTNWTTITGTLPTGSAQMTSIAVEDVDPNSAWVTFSGYSAGNKIFITSNGGTSWTNYSTGLPNLPTNRVTYWNGTKDGLYVGCDVGVYYRDSTMANWVAYNAGLPNVAITDLAIYYPLGKLRASTYGRSVWEVDLYNTGAMAPIANFTSDKQFICPTMTVNFSDLSTFAPTTWSWVFQGGSPATSTLQNPSITYPTAGTYSVSLTASNVNGASVMTKTLYIKVSGTTTIPMVEGFQLATFPPTGWQNYDSGGEGNVWQRSATVGKASTASMYYNNYNLDASNTRDEMRSPKYSFAGYTNVKMFFDVAYARYDPTYSDTLEILVSTNCGLSWTSHYIKGGTSLATAPDYTAAIFVPTAPQWRTDTVFLNAYSGMSNVMITFMNRGRYGQALYIDNINIAGTVASMPPTASFSFAATSPCSGQTVSFSDMSTNSPTSWNWTFPGGTPASSTAQNPTVTFATAGSYVATLTSSNSIGASTPVSQTITVLATPTVAASSASTAICSGQNVNLTGSGATTYSWSTGASTSTTNVAPSVNTIYTVTGTTSGCSSTAMVTVTVNPTPTVSVNSASVCSGASVNLTANGATTYSWNTGATSSAITVTPAITTVYTVTGTSAGCSNVRTTTVTVNATPTVAVNSSTVCFGTPANLTASGATTYSWNTGATSSAISVTPAVTTIYTVTGTTSGCSGSRTTTVTVNALPTATANNTGPVCAGNSVTLTSTSASSYTWSGPSAFNSNLQNPVIASTSSLNAGTYTLTFTGANTCTNVTTTALSINALPTVSSNTAAICSGAGTVTLTATGATTYTWNTGATTAAIAVSPPVTTNYTVTGTNGLGCRNSFTTTVYVSSSPTITVNSASVCSGNSVNLTANGAVTYSWSTGATTNTISVSPMSSTVYTITGYNAGCTNVKTSTVTVSPTPTLTLNSPAICNGGSVTVTASGATTYSWNTGATTANIIVSPASTTVYSVTGTTGACSSIRTTTVTVNTTPTVAVNSATLCSGNATTLTASGASTYSWSTGATTNNIVISPLVTTVYTITGSNGPCVDMKTTTVTVNATPTITVNSPAICNGGSVTVTAGGATTYSWNTGATTSNIIVSPSSTTVYTVTGTTGVCTGINTTTVTVNTTPTVSVNSATVCAGSSATLSAAGATTYSWNTGAATSNIVVTPTVNTTYTVTGNNGPCSDVKISNVMVNALPSVSLAASSSTACTSSTGGVTVTLTGSPAGGTYSGVGVTGNQFNPQATSGVYNAVYTYTSSTNGCVNSSSYPITVNVCTVVDAVKVDVNGNLQIIPNPNNGVFTIKSDLLENYDVIIYNSLGQLVGSFRPTMKETSVDLSLYGKGVYSVIFKSNDTFKIVKVIIE